MRGRRYVCVYLRSGSSSFLVSRQRLMLQSTLSVQRSLVLTRCSPCAALSTQSITSVAPNRRTFERPQRPAFHNSRSEEAKFKPKPRLTRTEDWKDQKHSTKFSNARPARFSNARVEGRPSRDANVAPQRSNWAPRTRPDASNTRYPRKPFSGRQDEDLLQPRRPSQPPYHVGIRVKELCAQGKLETAVQMVKDAPLSSVDVAVWNGLIKGALMDLRFKYAYELYIDVCVHQLHFAIDD
jgi:hypothetical protein